ncbi:MAG: Gfo/Idh/MocA family oxidoreductase [Candidatus Marinimicrobia bacterium]|nr:Gfo/Idh/MocA family oxidoreductase [Candidatus Neomarinimicrobiota bacterium]MCF7827986.1 Gfo/Idh/MocA family oxidoreductase [Candidatus Neomarinimicrobiota bacterium]MCF7879259.1 Gfo/Idh/MocA family oxidoreductase [Candidatus Neomarinimicrobiota bacterium]
MLRLGIAGIGHLGKHHLRLSREIEDLELVGCYDTDPEVQKREREKGIRVFDSFDAMLREVDAVDLVVPTDVHYAMAKQALESGKHVFLEKPITETVNQARELVALAKDNNITFQIGHIERFNPAITSLGATSLEPRFIESHRLAQFQQRGTEVAVILDLMIHDIDIILSLVKSPVKSVEASGVPVITNSVDIANARLTFENGCVANITASRISQKAMRKLRIFQRAAYISIDFQQGTTEIYRLRDTGEEESPNIPLILGELEHDGQKKQIIYEQPKIEETNALKEELKSFIHAVENGERPVVSGEDGVRALEVAQLIQEKVKEYSVLQS